MRKLKMKDVFTREAYGEGGLTAEERRHQLKIEQASEYSGWRRYGDTCDALLKQIPHEWWEKYNAEHIGEVMSMLKTAYENGRYYESKARERGEI